MVHVFSGGVFINIYIYIQYYISIKKSEEFFFPGPKNQVPDPGAKKDHVFSFGLLKVNFFTSA